MRGVLGGALPRQPSASACSNAPPATDLWIRSVSRGSSTELAGRRLRP
jgi:hypothetical protein